MSRPPKPTEKPLRPFFSSGPCAKRPGWTTAALDSALAGRSHRSVEGRQRLKLAIERTRDLLKPPAGYEIAIVPGSDTGAFEMAMWNLLGPLGVDGFAWDSFGRIWLRDALDELRLDTRLYEAEPGLLPDLSKADFSRDVIFTWNGTTSGVRVPNADWIADDRAGLTLCDATSALFAEEIDLGKIDVLTYSWQKGLGGEAAHGMMLLSPRALARLKSHRPTWPVPKLFRLTTANGILAEVFEGVTINTPSMLCVEDYLDALQWAQGIGGTAAMIARARANAAVLYEWIDKVDWAQPLAVDAATRSNTSVTMRFADARVSGLPDHGLALMRQMTDLLAREGAAYDIDAYRGMPPGLRVWCGPTIEAADVARLIPWLDWAYGEATAAIGL